MADLRPEAARVEEPAPTFKDRLYAVPVLGTAMRMQDRYKADDADQHAAAIGFFGFVSLFPLMLLALSVAGMVLAGDPVAQADFADTLIDAIPGFRGAFGEGDTAVQSAINTLAKNAGSVGLVGLVSLVFTGLKVINSAHRATMAVFHVDAQVPGPALRLRQLGALVVLGLLAIIGVAATGLVGAAASLATDEAAALAGSGRAVNGALQAVATIIGLLASVGVDFLLFVASFKMLSHGRGPAFKHLWPGAVLSAVGWTALKAFGATYVTGQIAKTNAAIGALGGVVGLLLLLYLAGRVYVYGAELASLVRQPGADLAARYEEVTSEDAEILGAVETGARSSEGSSHGPSAAWAHLDPMGGLVPAALQPAIAPPHVRQIQQVPNQVAVAAALAAGAAAALFLSSRDRGPFG